MKLLKLLLFSLPLILLVSCDKESPDWQKEKEQLLGEWSISTVFKVKGDGVDSTFTVLGNLEFIDDIAILERGIFSLKEIYDYYYQPDPKTIIFISETINFGSFSRWPSVHEVISATDRKQEWKGETSSLGFDPDTGMTFEIQIETETTLSKK